MKKILTAIGNPEIAEKLSKENNIEINYKDIQYKEGILEILENDNKINLIIINENIPGKIEINLLIENILKINSQIKIYLITKNKNIKIIKNNIYIFDEINYKKIKEKIIQEEIILEQKEENKIIKRKQEKIEIKNVETEKMNINNYDKEELCKDESKYIIILGPQNVGKSIVAIILSFLASHQKKKILLVDMDIENGNINTMFQVKKKVNKIQKIKNNLDFICTKDSIKNIEKNYDFVFIDNNKNKLNKNYKIIFISDSNLIGIEKSKKILNKLNLIKNKNNILIINNYNKNSIDIKILKNIFYEFINVKKIKYSEKYNLIINDFNKINLNIFFYKKYKKIIQKIIN